METGLQDRQYWVDMLYRVAHPVLNALANEQLQATMPVEMRPGHERRHVSPLEAFGRTLAGLAPWLEATGLSPQEDTLRQEMRQLAQRALRVGCDPASPDYLNFSQDRQPLVDTAFLVQGIMRAPQALWHGLPADTHRLVIDAVKQARVVLPNFNNWLLFAGMVEAFLHWAASQGDVVRLDYALRQHEQWYAGDGVYQDGPHFHWDYYNSFVIHPMLLDISRAVQGVSPLWDELSRPFLPRAQRYAQILERLIAPDGTFPAVGRSIAYRSGAFHLLAQLAWQQQLPAGLAPAQVRGALTAVIQQTLAKPHTFDQQGWLRIGLSGHQPGLGEIYISTGSLYMCTLSFLPLGLSPQQPFWAGAAQPWTSQRLWAGDDMPYDAAQD